MPDIAPPAQDRLQRRGLVPVKAHHPAPLRPDRPMRSRVRLRRFNRFTKRGSIPVSERKLMLLGWIATATAVAMYLSYIDQIQLKSGGTEGFGDSTAGDDGELLALGGLRVSARKAGLADRVRQCAGGDPGRDLPVHGALILATLTLPALRASLPLPWGEGNSEWEGEGSRQPIRPPCPSTPAPACARRAFRRGARAARSAARS